MFVLKLSSIRIYLEHKQVTPVLSSCKKVYCEYTFLISKLTKNKQWSLIRISIKTKHFYSWLENYDVAQKLK